MSDSKEIKFKFVVDAQSARQAERAFDELIKRAQELNKALAGLGGTMSGGGGGGGLGGGVGKGTPSNQSTLASKGATSRPSSFTQVLTANTDAFKKMGEHGAGAMRVLTNVLTREMAAQEKQIGILTKRLENLVATYDKVGGSASQTGRQLEGKILRLQGRISGHQDQQGALNDMKPHTPWLPDIDAPEEKKSMRERAKGWLQQKGIYGPAAAQEGGASPMIQGLAPNSMAGWLKVGGMIAAGTMAAVNQGMAGTRDFSSEAARRGDLVNGRIRAIRGGDISDLQALRMMSGTDRQNLRDQGGNLAGAESYGNAGMALLSNLAGAATGGAIGTKGGLLTPFTDASRGTAMGGNVTKQIDEFKNRTEFLDRKMALEYFDRSFSSRVQAKRILGMGIGRRKVTGPGGTAEVDEDWYGQEDKRLTGLGLDVGVKMSAKMAVQSLAGNRAGHRNAEAAMYAQAQGIGGYEQLLAASERLGMGNVMAKAALSGGIDATAGVRLGAGVLGTGFDVSGMTSRGGVLAAIQNGFGFRNEASDFNQADRALAGLQMGDSISTGQTSPFQRGANLLAAINAGAGSGSYLADYVGNQMSMQKMIDIASGSDEDPLLGDLVSGGPKAAQDMVKKTLSGKFNSAMDLVYSGGLGGGPMQDAVTKFRSSGMDIDSYLQKLRMEGRSGEVDTLGRAFSLGSGSGTSQEAGVGLARTLSGIGGELKQGGIGLSKQDELVQAKLDQQSKEVERNSSQLRDNFKTMAADFTVGGKEMQKALMTMGTDLNRSAEDFVKSLDRVTKAADMAAFKLSGGKIVPPSKAGPK